MRTRIGFLVLTALLSAQAFAQTGDGKLRIIIFGAHPDDAEYRGAGVAMKWARMGYHVKFVFCHQRRYRSLADRGRAAGAAEKERGGGGRPATGRYNRGAGHS